ncbi:putative phosphoinositide phosphatase SAC6 [Monocercomonoides exilis]|uniref:putative phosphoinositide phosphatase SAC6 n=1 Tax=Monocercomonoides exilis TaxID=2049356 RepID=UPI003559D7DC|nr:putative phosphoinositide phosphatase SAC6 [Monocercomonoides exilis]|eukprot:MONOS_8631.1-p1 / transcript=MONOS_8631.1 / gene=MONOS_8631 / organism=Monocercomonoides_exilis_PA203 / gene_product=SAC-like protein / transcript_product=SAC-like protein / location=Mono_scaffold00330:7728-9920(-) / protein_length=730 / sequence_SO=supercontig / SO=protein_coding / is_pseudo=false
MYPRKRDLLNQLTDEKAKKEANIYFSYFRRMIHDKHLYTSLHSKPIRTNLNLPLVRSWTLSLSCQLAHFHSSNNSDTPFWDPEFTWNHYLIQPLIKTPIEKSVMRLIRGFVGIETVPRDGDIVSLMLISRQCNERAGFRLQNRGADENGWSGNTFETETICVVGGGNQQRLCSCVQLRGSAFIAWSQQPNMRMHPSVLFPSTQSASSNVARKALEKLFERYGDVQVVSLCGQSKHEKSLADSFYQQCQLLGNEKGRQHQLRFCSFDFDKVCGWTHMDRVGLVVSEAMSEPDGLFFAARFEDGSKTGTKVLSRQSHVIRTSGFDCLDRTNVVQHVIGTEIIRKMLLFVDQLSTAKAASRSNSAATSSLITRNMSNISLSPSPSPSPSLSPTPSPFDLRHSPRNAIHKRLPSIPAPSTPSLGSLPLGASLPSTADAAAIHLPFSTGSLSEGPFPSSSPSPIVSHPSSMQSSISSYSSSSSALQTSSSSSLSSSSPSPSPSPASSSPSSRQLHPAHPSSRSFRRFPPLPSTELPVIDAAIRTLWKDNGNAISQIVAGTQSKKSWFTETHKSSVISRLADKWIDVKRYVGSNFAEPSQQDEVDFWLGKGSFDPEIRLPQMSHKRPQRKMIVFLVFLALLSLFVSSVIAPQQTSFFRSQSLNATVDVMLFILSFAVCSVLLFLLILFPLIKNHPNSFIGHSSQVHKQMPPSSRSQTIKQHVHITSSEEKSNRFLE